jgi:hypothetical protein
MRFWIDGKLTAFRRFSFRGGAQRNVIRSSSAVPSVPAVASASTLRPFRAAVRARAERDGDGGEGAHVCWSVAGSATCASVARGCRVAVAVRVADRDLRDAARCAAVVRLFRQTRTQISQRPFTSRSRSQT